MTPGTQGDDLGQHLLVDDDVVRRLVGAARLLPGEHVLDAGAGPGAITERLAAAVGDGGTVHAVEIDAALAATLRGRVPPNVRVWQEDLLRMALPAVDAVVANPPFKIAAPLVERLVQARVPRVVLIVPLELANRLTAQPGQERYGRLTVRVGAAANVDDLGRISRRAFAPQPAVDCGAVRLTPIATEPFDTELLARVVDVAFAAPRRKARKAFAPLATVLRQDSAALSAVLEAQPWADVPVRSLPPAAFVTVARALA